MVVIEHEEFGLDVQLLLEPAQSLDLPRFVIVFDDLVSLRKDEGVHWYSVVVLQLELELHTNLVQLRLVYQQDLFVELEVFLLRLRILSSLVYEQLIWFLFRQNQVFTADDGKPFLLVANDHADNFIWLSCSRGQQIDVDEVGMHLLK